MHTQYTHTHSLTLPFKMLPPLNFINSHRLVDTHHFNYVLFRSATPHYCECNATNRLVVAVLTQKKKGSFALTSRVKRKYIYSFIQDRGDDRGPTLGDCAGGSIWPFFLSRNDICACSMSCMCTRPAAMLVAGLIVLGSATPTE
jgi:hypothetical protein